MHKVLRTFLPISLCLVVASAGLATVASAQGIPTNMPGVMAYGAPPADFDPLGATDAQLATHHLPPRPSAQIAPKAYARWAQAVTSGATAIVPHFTHTGISHGPARIFGGTERGMAQGVDNTQAQSTNWSGVALVGNGSDPFSLEAIQFTSVVPIAQMPFGTCLGAWRYGSAWVGIDGYNNGDVFQAGYEFDAYCNDSGAETAAGYYAWYEWYPNDSVAIDNFPISPGDVIYTEVWNTSATEGNAYIADLSTNSNVTFTFTAPNGTSLAGASAEWIVERPEVNNSLTALTNYVAEPFGGNEAWNYTATNPTYYMPSYVTSGTVTKYNITMLNNSNAAISYVTIDVGADDLWFYNEGTDR